MLEEADPFVVLSVLIVVSAILLTIVLAYVFYRTNPDSFDWETFAPMDCGLVDQYRSQEDRDPVYRAGTILPGSRGDYGHVHPNPTVRSGK